MKRISIKEFEELYKLYQPNYSELDMLDLIDSMLTFKHKKQLTISNTEYDGLVFTLFYENKLKNL